MNRETALARLRSEVFDVLIVGGGASGLGCALDAASRGYATALVESADFAKATSSRSTKLVHGGVRYLRDGRFALVREALTERGRLRENAPGYVRELEFFLPAPALLDRMYYGAGLKLYDLLAGSTGFPKSRIVRDGVTYWDAQFDDARLAVGIARTAVSHGAAVANYVRARAPRYDGGRIRGVDAADAESGETFPIRARSVVNATGIFADEMRMLDDPSATPLLTFSRGSHIVVSKRVLADPSRALLVPRTTDGRVLFALPWYGSTLVGTTDVPVPCPELDPAPSPNEVEYLVRTANAYLAQSIEYGDIRSAFAGLRPLLRQSSAIATAKLSREHVVDISRSGMVTLAGGKWTTYRKMAQDAIDAAAREGVLPAAPCRTAALRICADERPSELHARIAHAVNVEMARSVEDILARRTRLLFLDAPQAQALAQQVASQLASLLGRSPAWAQEQRSAFVNLAKTYTLPA